MRPKDPKVEGVKSRWEISPEAPRKIALNFLGRPTRLRSLPGKLLEPTWRPRGSRRPPGANFAPKLVPKWSPQGSFLELFSPLLERWFSILLLSLIVDCCPRDFSRFNIGRQKEGQSEHQGLPKWRPQRSPGPPGRNLAGKFIRRPPGR